MILATVYHLICGWAADAADLFVPHHIKVRRLKRQVDELTKLVIEERVIAEIRARRERGLAKYGVGMERDDLSMLEWLQHAKQEALDLAIYLEKLIDQLQRK